MDLFLFDYKITEKKKHQIFTVQNNDQILRNLNYLNRKGAKIVLRCPIIPGINDTTDHFEAIVKLGNRLGNIVEIELMPYHNYGVHKYEQIGLKRPGIDNPPVNDSLLNRWIEALRALGCNKIKEQSLHP